jgi:hypothetical protein
MSDQPISDLRRRMLQDMAVRQFGEKTQHDYIRHVEAFARFLGRSPETVTVDDLRRFQFPPRLVAAMPLERLAVPRQGPALAADKPAVEPGLSYGGGGGGAWLLDAAYAAS